MLTSVLFVAPRSQFAASCREREHMPAFGERERCGSPSRFSMVNPEGRLLRPPD
jgi:hypothetical protein